MLKLVQSWREFYFVRGEEAAKVFHAFNRMTRGEEQYLVALYTNKYLLLAVLFWIINAFPELLFYSLFQLYSIHKYIEVITT